MKKLCVLLLVCVCLGSSLAGCAGVVHSGDERARRYSLINQAHRRMFVDDLDALVLYDRSSRLSQWHQDIGE